MIYRVNAARKSVSGLDNYYQGESSEDFTILFATENVLYSQASGRTDKVVASGLKGRGLFH